MLEIGIIGVVASLITEGIKRYFGTTSWGSRAVVVGLSLLFGAGYWFLKDTSLWTSFLGILATASTVYAFLIKK